MAGMFPSCMAAATGGVVLVVMNVLVVAGIVARLGRWTAGVLVMMVLVGLFLKLGCKMGQGSLGMVAASTLSNMMTVPGLVSLV